MPAGLHIVHIEFFLELPTKECVRLGHQVRLVMVEKRFVSWWCKTVHHMGWPL